jgi:hypothetical protein
MKLPFRGAVDCDIHPAPPPMSALLPYMSFASGTSIASASP